MAKQSRWITTRKLLPGLSLLVAVSLYGLYRSAFGFLLPDPILPAAESGDTAQVAKLLKNGANIEAKNVIGMTPLMRAAEFGHSDTVQYLLQHGANINAQDMSGFTALRVAASPGGHADTVALLLQSGANPNAADKEGRTALIWASAYSNPATVKTLIMHKELVNSRDDHGLTALAMARGDKQELTGNTGNSDSAKLIIKAGGKM